MSLQEITAIYLGEVARNEDWRCIETEVTDSPDGRALVGDRLRITCHDNDNELINRLSYRFFGQFHESEKWGLQFHASTFMRAQPHGRAGIVQYLQHAPWIGHQVACTLWEKFKENAVRVVREKPDVAAAACGRHFSEDRAEEAAAWLRQEQELEGCNIDLMDLLTGRGFPRATAKKALQAWGNRASERIQQCPYRLMLFRGCGFKKTDKMYLDLGLPPDAIRRQAFCTWHALASDTDGHCWKSVHAIVSHLERNVAGCGLNPPKGAKLAKKMKLVATRRDRLGNLWFGESSRANAERTVAELVAQWLDHNGELAWPDVAKIPGLSDHQREELGKALAGPLGLLTGSPGTGKTYSLAALVSMLPIGDVAVACPTGKAADRARQALASYGCFPQVSTIHGLLRIKKSDIGEGWAFEHGPGKPLPFRYVIVDESSMTDIKLFASLCLALAHGTHLLLVGDPNQLPPVGPGAPLRDLIAAALPCGRLTEIRRNAGSIVEVCAAIRDDKPWQPDSKIDLEAGKNLRLLECGNDSQQVAQMLRAINVARMTGADPVWDVQVICALNTKGDLSRKKLNSLLQAELNKSGEKRPGNPFKPQDKVVNTKNTFFKIHDPSNPKSEEEVFCCNGELGEVVEVQDKLTIIKVGGDRMIRVGIGKQKQSAEEEAEEAANEEENENNQRTDTGCTWDLGYSLSCHKCVHPDTLVESAEGLLPIRSISPIGVIGTPNGQQKYRNRVYFANRECLKITTEDCHEIIVTTDHRCDTWRGDSYQLIEASELCVGDWFRQKLSVSIEPSEPVILPPKPTVDVRAEDYSIPSEMSPELAEFLGLMVADGVLFPSGIRLGKRHREVVDRFASLVQQLFGYKCDVTESDYAKMWVAECKSTLVAQWLYSLGGLFPKSKHVPDCILKSTSTYHRHFLRGLFEDGSVHLVSKGPRKGKQIDHIQLSSCFPMVRQAVRAMLMRLGIVCGGNSQRRCNDAMYIYGEYVAQFRSKVGFISKFKIDRLKLPHAESNQRYRIPLSRSIAKKIGLSKYLRQNALNSGYISRNTASLYSTSWTNQALQWHHSRIKKIEKVQCPAMCVEVPGEGMFLQNGFAMGNSQGSEWPVVIVVIDDAAKRVCSREWIYTAISRAKKLCILIGKRDTLNRFCRKEVLPSRKTFLVEQIEEQRELMKAQMMVEDAA